MAQGYAATSMADIARAAGVSRPAVYQYFADKDDVFASAFSAVFEARVDAALAALDEADDMPAALDALLQRFEGDLWELTAASPHHEELVAAKSPAVADAIGREIDRLWAAVDRWVADRVSTSDADGRRRADWIDLLRWAPRGMQLDQPAVVEYRRRLAALARSVAADMAPMVIR